MEFNYRKVVLNKRSEAFMHRRHPWIFSGAIRFKEDLNNGEIVQVYSSKDAYLATGYYQKGSIAIRILTYLEEDINLSFWSTKIENALALRKALGLWNNDATNCMRLINGEGDGIPGLIIDYYNGHLVIQLHTVGIAQHEEILLEALGKLLGITMIGHTIQNKYDKSPNIKSKESLEITVKENNISFLIDPIQGQKTGFFLDQRNNRSLLGSYAKDKKCLNLFCYTGGFSLYALKQGAKSVHSVDVSQYAIEHLDKNIELNELHTSNHVSEIADVRNYLQNTDDSDFDLVIVDPPAYAKSVKKRHNAIQAYKRLNHLAFSKVKSGGIVFTFSCSQVVDPTMFEGAIRAAAIESRRSIQILHYLSQGPDHPVDVYHTEGKYLKGLVLRLD